MSAFDLMLLLGQKTLILSLAALGVWVVLKISRCHSPQIHRFSWGMVLILGLIGCGIPISIPVLQDAVQEQSVLETAHVIPQATEPQEVSELLWAASSRKISRS